MAHAMNSIEKIIANHADVATSVSPGRRGGRSGDLHGHRRDREPSRMQRCFGGYPGPAWRRQIIDAGGIVNLIAGQPEPS